MHYAFDITRKSRTTLDQFFENYSSEQLNKVPAGFNNNLIWNIAHITVVQQLLIYNLSDLPMMLPDEMIAKYRRGTKPEADVSHPELNEIRSLLFSPIDKTEQDYKSGLFKNYREFTTMTGFTLRSADDAIAFNYYHEAMHLGMMMGIRKFV